MQYFRRLYGSQASIHIYLQTNFTPALAFANTQGDFIDLLNHTKNKTHGHGRGSSSPPHLVSSEFDDDGRRKRTGTWVTASAHIITAVIGSGVLSLAWAIAQLGWLAGTLALLLFSIITWFASTLLADCYRNPSTGTRNYRYIDAVRNNLGGNYHKLCGVAQYTTLIGTTIGYTITSFTSMGAIKRLHCFHKHGHEASCPVSNSMFMLIFAVAQIILSQIPNFQDLSFLSILAALMSFGYSFIGLSLSITKIEEGTSGKTSLTGTTVGVDLTKSQKVWSSLEALGNIAFAYSFSIVLLEIQYTLKSSPPENQVMRKANFVGFSIITLFYMSCGLLAYAAFGNKAPGNFLSGFGFYDPFWLIDLGNLCIIIHLIGAYQVFCQPIFQLAENWCREQWPENRFIRKSVQIKIPSCGVYNVNVFRVVWRVAFVMTTTVVAMSLPFFNDIAGLLGAFTFWPLTVYFPIEMHISSAKIRPLTLKWIWLKVLSGVCLTVSLLAAAGSIQGVIGDLKTYKPFSSLP